ncbi:hypothetical protein BGY98DRAFT_1174452 [Russula aff. rugulosa BPL654]|nr:hypothetical protein BGY98DRAFT_1174452 [Russula aff. rugulosa BPL654]
MVNYHDPVVVARDYSALSRFWHALAGLYLCVCPAAHGLCSHSVSNHPVFHFQLGVFHYSRLRVECLPKTSPLPLDDMVGFDVTARYNCEVETAFQVTFAYLATASASLLIVLRILAIWNMKKPIIAIATVAWGASSIFQIQVTNPQIANLNTLVTFTTDIILLLIMFFGLFRLRSHKSSAFGMGRLLWRQALVWLLVAFIADILPLVFVCLNLNDPLDDIFLFPSVVASSIAVTRIHRGLVDYASAGCTEQCRRQFDASHSKANGRAEWKVNRVPITRTQLSRMEVAIPEMYEQDETPQMSQHISQLCEKPAGQPGLDENIENASYFILGMLAAPKGHRQVEKGGGWRDGTIQYRKLDARNGNPCCPLTVKKPSSADDGTVQQADINSWRVTDCQTVSVSSPSERVLVASKAQQSIIIDDFRRTADRRAFKPSTETSFSFRFGMCR